MNMAAAKNGLKAKALKSIVPHLVSPRACSREDLQEILAALGGYYKGTPRSGLCDYCCHFRKGGATICWSFGLACDFEELMCCVHVFLCFTYVLAASVGGNISFLLSVLQECDTLPRGPEQEAEDYFAGARLSFTMYVGLQAAGIKQTCCYMCHRRTTLRCGLCSIPICPRHSSPFSWVDDEPESRICFPCEMSDRLLGCNGLVFTGDHPRMDQTHQR